MLRIYGVRFESPFFTSLIAFGNPDTKDAARVAQAYTPDSIWRNRDQFFQGTAAIQAFLTKKWETEHNYRLRKELFAFQDNKM